MLTDAVKKRPNYPRHTLVLVRDATAARATLARAIRLARRSRGRVTALRIFDEPRSFFLPPRAREEHEKLFVDVMSSLEQELTALVEGLEGAGEVEISCRVQRGRLWREVARAVERDDHDLLLLSLPMNAARGAGLDADALKLVRRCTCPVWVDRSPEKPVRRVAVAVDLELGDSGEPSVSNQLVELGSRLAELEGAEVHVVHSWTLYREETTLRFAGDAAGWLERDAAGRHSERLRAFVGGFPGLVPEVHLEHGRPEETIPSLLRRERIDLLVLASLNRMSLPGILIGGTAERLLHRVSCSVVVATPDAARAASAEMTGTSEAEEGG